jgi:dinuclear metal center YbgI/SA1388 family protein
MKTISDVIQHLESVAPNRYQESYDNSGLIVGEHSTIVKGITFSLDATEEVVDDAIKNDCNLIVAHHPIVFKGLKRFNGSNYVERTIIKAIKNDIAIYAIHTNLDNVLHQGVNETIAKKIGLINIEILAPKHGEFILATLIPKTEDIDAYSILQRWKDSHSSFGGETSIFRMDNTIQLTLPRHLMGPIQKLELGQWVFSPIENGGLSIGSGALGLLPEPVEPLEFLSQLKSLMNTSMIRYTTPPKKQIQKIAVCGGSGSFLLSTAKKAGADMFITGDFKYHEFFDAEKDIIIADIGHFESEQFTIPLLFSIISQKSPKFALRLTEANTNPINYL